MDSILSSRTFLLEPDRIEEPFNWVEHIPFAFYLTEVLAPRVFVELGTHSGNSYLAFCQAGKFLNLSMKSFAVDTWQGDSQAGFYSDQVYQSLKRYHDNHYGAFSSLLRMTFDQACQNFRDGSVDLLHIDGMHTYEAVLHDFETWRPKLSTDAVVLFHDINVWHGDFGVWKLWAELRTRYPSLEFKHGSGLGVLAVGEKVPLAFNDLTKHACTLERMFYALGSRLSCRAAASLRSRVEKHQAVRVYVDHGNDFSQDQSFFAEIEDGQMVNIVFAEGERVRRLRVDPTECALILEIISARVLGGDGVWHDCEPETNALERLGAGDQTWWYYVTSDPQIIFDLSGCSTAVAFKLCFSIKATGDEALRTIALAKATKLEESQREHEVSRQYIVEMKEILSLREESLVELRQHMNNIEASKTWRWANTILGPFRRVRSILRTTPQSLEENGAGGCHTAEHLSGYEEWVKSGQGLHAGQENLGVGGETLPVVSVLLPTYNTNGRYLAACIDSVRKQTYTRWELCIADDASTQPETLAFLQALEKSEPRIKLTFRNVNGHISAASNSALALATGEFVCFLDHDDMLAPNALEEMVRASLGSPAADIFYSDEDKLLGETRVTPHFKPDWSPELLHSVNYISHFCMIRRSLVCDVGGFREGLEGAQDLDLILRVSARAREVVHVSHVLYHWRMHPASTSANISCKSYASSAGIKALQDSLAASGELADVFETDPTNYAVIYYPTPVERTSSKMDQLRSQGFNPSRPLLTVLLPSFGALPAAEVTFKNLLSKNTYSNVEFVFMLRRQEAESPIAMRMLLHSHTRVVFSEDFKGNAFGSAVDAVSGDFVTVIEPGVEMDTEAWAEILIGYAQRTGLGAVGPLILEQESIYSAGDVWSSQAGFVPAFKGLPLNATGYFNYPYLTRNTLLLRAACFCVRREVLMTSLDRSDTLDSLDALLADACLRMHTQGLRHVFLPFVRAQLHASKRPVAIEGTDHDQLELCRRWAAAVSIDPYYNKCLSVAQPYARVGD